MADKYSTIQQHQPLRVPSGWDRQEKALIVQLDEIFDDIYRRFGRLRIEDMGKDFRQRLEDDEGNVATLELTASGLDLRMTTAEGKISTNEANITLANNAITAEVTRATNAEGTKYTIRSGIDIKAEGIEISGSQYVKIASGGYFQVQTGNFGIDTNSSSHVLWSGASTAENSSFWIKKDGTIKSTSGTIGGWTLAANKLSSGSSTGYVALDSGTSNTYTIWAGNETAASAPFSVKRDGTLKSTSGTIGGWTLGANRLSSGSTTGYVALDSNSSNTYAIWAGNATDASAPFRVKRDGSLYSTSGEIGGWSLASNKLSSGSSTGYVALDSNTSNTYALWCGGETAASAPFRLKRDGSLAVTKLLAIGSDGTSETTVNLRTAGLWKLSGNTISSYTTDSITLSNGATINFIKASSLSVGVGGGANSVAVYNGESMVSGTGKAVEVTSPGTGTYSYSGSSLKVPLRITVGGSLVSQTDVYVTDTSGKGLAYDAGWKGAGSAVSYTSGSQSVTVPSSETGGQTTTLNITATWTAGYNNANSKYTSAGSRQWGYYSNGSWHGYGSTGMTLYQKNS